MLSTGLLGQQPSGASTRQAVPRIRFEHLTTADGLPENSVTSILQDHLGLMWLGTQNGLVRYDGTTMTTFRYDPRQPFSLKGRQVRALHENRNGDIWVGCESLFRFERATGRFIEYPQPKANRADKEVRIDFLHEDQQGYIWTITAQNDFETYVLDRLDPKTKTWLSFRHNQKNTHSLASDNVYASTANVLKFSFAEAPDGTIWVVTRGATENILHWFDPKTAQFNRFQPKASPDILHAFKKAGFVLPVGDQLYVSSYVNGMFRLNPKTGQLTQFKHDPRNPASLQADSVSWLFRSRDGLIWVPNPQSVDRFDPKTGQFTHYVSRPNDPTTPSKNLVRGLHEMPNGDIWFVAGNGINLYHRQSNRFVRYEHNLAGGEENLQGNIIFSFLVDKTGLVWAGSWGLGLNKQSRMAHFPLLTSKAGSSNSLQSNEVKTVYEAPSEPGVIWFGTDKGLSRLDKKTGLYTHYRHDSLSRHSLGKGEVWALAEDPKGRFWVGTSANGLYQMDRKTGQFTRFVPDLKKNPNESRFQYIRRLLPASDGTLWVVTDAELVHADVDQQRYQYFHKTADAYSPDLFASLTPLLISQRRIADILHPQGKVDKTVAFVLNAPTDLCVVIGGSMRADVKWDYGWIEDANGKTVWEMTIENSKTDSFSDQRIEVKTLQLPAGRYRLRYRSDNAFYYGSWPMFPPIHADLWGVQIVKVTPDERSALDRLIARKYQREGLSDNTLFTIRQDKQGRIWTGSNSGGVCMLDPATGRFSTWMTKLNGPSCVLALLEDQSSGGWWVGDYANGLLLLDQTGKRIRSYNSTNGLPGDRVSAIQRDKQGWLWLMTDNGLCRFNPKTEQFLSFTDQNGIPAKGRGIADGSFKAQDGQLYFWGSKGVNAFYPDQVQNDTYTPSVILTDLSINGKLATLSPDGQLPTHVSMADDITLPHDQNDLNFQFAALNYNRGSESQYAFKLSPLDTAWLPIGTTRQARFLDLQPGTYTFHVKAANADGVWNEKGTSIQLTISPPWWQTWWAYMAYALLISGAIWTFIHYRSSVLRQENRILEEKVARRTNEVQEQKEEIEAQRDHLEQTLTELKTTQDQLIQKEKLASLGELTAGIAHEIQNPLNFVNNFSEVSTELIDELKEGPFQNLPDSEKKYAEEILGDLTSNLQKITHHGGRASSIVKGMLAHSRTETSEKRPTDANALADEYLKIAYHGLRAKDKRFTCGLVSEFDGTLAPVVMVPQEIGRVLLNLYNNAFYAVSERVKKTNEPDYQPTVTVSTRQLRNAVEIRVSDNGTGIPDSVKAKIFQPFFTTKPTGEGTGLGLSLSYDIITKGHSGTFKVESIEGNGTTFVIQLPA
ncbi:sensor histidine kinase [Spirosoma harenae]